MSPAGFHRAFIKVLFHTWWGLASAVSTVASLVALFLAPRFLALPAELKPLIPWILGGVFLITLYRAAWLLYEQGETEKESLRAEVADLKRKPYNEAHSRLVEGKLARFEVIDRDLLRFLLHRGSVEEMAMRSSCLVGVNACQGAANKLQMEGLTTSTHEESSPSYPRGRVWWAINPQFAEVLRDLLYPRNQSEGKPSFRI